MKKNYFFLGAIVCVWTFISPIVLSAKVMDTRDIELRTMADTDNELRSLLPVRAWIDGYTIYIAFRGLPSMATLIITNVESGKSVVESFPSLQLLSIPISSKGGNYKIQIDYEGNTFIGDFMI